LNDGLSGTAETKIAFIGNGEWHDWAIGQYTHGVVCQEELTAEEMAARMAGEADEAARKAEEERLAAEEVARIAGQFFVNCDKRHYSESMTYCESKGA